MYACILNIEGKCQGVLCDHVWIQQLKAVRFCPDSLVLLSGSFRVSIPVFSVKKKKGTWSHFPVQIRKRRKKIIQFMTGIIYEKSDKVEIAPCKKNSDSLKTDKRIH